MGDDDLTLAAPSTGPRSTDSLAGETLGDFRLIRRIAAGGMGEVYEAEQLRPLRRRVALKLIKRGLDTDQIVARFSAERQALAVMDHPYIARVFAAAALPDGRPYFVMEYVDGKPIDDYCDVNRLSTHDRLRLFIQVCEGVQHAHQKAVLHRDLKSSNVLVAAVDGRPVPKIIDFGVAKAIAAPLTERTLMTDVGQFLGTPEYMSPEQADLTEEDVDTRTDVYSLGVMLYRILVGALPFESQELRRAGVEGMRRMIREKEPTRPSTRVTTLGSDESTACATARSTSPARLVRELRGDLDWIVLKAIEKDRSRRYASPLDLARDVQRHLDRQPVEAGPPSRAYRFRKFVARHRVGVLAGAAVVIALLVGLTAATWGLVRALRAEAEAKHEAAKSEAVNDFLQEMLSSVSPEEAQGHVVSVRQVLDEASEKIGKSSLADQPEVEAAVRNTIGSTYEALGLYDAAEPHLRAALETRRRLYGSDDEEVGESLHSLGRLAWDKTDYATAEDLIRQALAVKRKRFGDENESVLACLSDLAVVLQSRGDDGAEASFREALSLARRLPGDHRRSIAENSGNLAWVLRSKGQYEESEKLSREALDLSRELFGAEHPNVLVGQVNLAAFLVLRQKFDEAESLYVASLEPMKKVFGAEHPTTLGGVKALSELYLTRDEPDRAEPLIADALEKAERTLGPDHTLTISLLADMGWVYRARGDLARAEPYYREVRMRRLRTIGPEHPLTIRAGWQVARVLVDRRHYTEARDLARETLVTARKVLPEGNENRSSTLLYLGLALIGCGDHAGAEPILRECVQSFSKTKHEGDWELAEAESALGAALAGLGQFETAEPMLLKACEELRADPVTPRVSIHRATAWLVGLYEAWEAADPKIGKEAEAAKWRHELTALDAKS